jgi:hypothetical protein
LFQLSQSLSALGRGPGLRRAEVASATQAGRRDPICFLACLGSHAFFQLSAFNFPNLPLVGSDPAFGPRQFETGPFGFHADFRALIGGDKKAQTEVAGVAKCWNWKRDGFDESDLEKHTDAAFFS